VPLRAITALCVHGAKRAREVSSLWGEQEKCWPSVVQDDQMLLAVFEKGLRDRHSPICILSQDGNGDRRVQARKGTCCSSLVKITALYVHGASRRIGYGASRRRARHQ
jgi:hypothetical protein